MKKLILAVAMLTFTFSISLISEEIEPSEKATNESIVTTSNIVEIKTSAICEHCKETIEDAVGKVDGVKNSVLDLDTKIVTIEYENEKTDVETLKNAISDAGYNADEVKRDFKAYRKLQKCCKVK